MAVVANDIRVVPTGLVNPVLITINPYFHTCHNIVHIRLGVIDSHIILTNHMNLSNRISLDGQTNLSNRTNPVNRINLEGRNYPRVPNCLRVLNIHPI